MLEKVKFQEMHSILLRFFDANLNLIVTLLDNIHLKLKRKIISMSVARGPPFRDHPFMVTAGWCAEAENVVSIQFAVRLVA